MPQLARLDYPTLDTAGNATAGVSVAVYREGATVSGNQSGAAPTAFTVRHLGKLAANDTVFVNAITGTTYNVTAVTQTTVTLSGYVGTLTLNNGDRLVPSNNLPTLYGDDQAGATTVNPLTSSSTGRVNCWLPFGNYDLVMSGGGLTTTLYSSQLMPTEAPVYGNTFYAESYGLTVAGVQAALDECANAGGGIVYVPSSASILVTNTSVKIPNHVSLIGTGANPGSGDTFIANASTNVSAMVENKSQDGTQQYCYVANLSINGKQSTGAVVSAGLKMVSVFDGSRFKDLLVTSCSGNGIYMTNAGGFSFGPYCLDNVWCINNGSDNIYFKDVGGSVFIRNISCTSNAANTAGIRINNSITTTMLGWVIDGVHSETAVAGQVILIDGAACVSVNNVFHTTGSAGLTDVVKIQNTSGGTDFQAPSGITCRNIYSNVTGVNLINDAWSGVTMARATYGDYIAWYAPPVSTSNGLGQVCGLQYQRMGQNIGTAATISPLEGNFFNLINNVTINNITNSAREKGREITFLSTGTPTFAHNAGGTGNIRCAGSVNLVMAANSRVKFISDGTLWWQASAVVNA